MAAFLRSGVGKFDLQEILLGTTARQISSPCSWLLSGHRIFWSLSSLRDSPIDVLIGIFNVASFTVYTAIV